MNPSENFDAKDEWRLGLEPEGSGHASADEVRALSPSPDERLDRPVHVITVEQFAWGLIALWTLVTRIAALAARPLDPPEARRALAAYDLAHRTAEAAAAGFHPAMASWTDLLEAGIFAGAGANDFTSRVLAVLAGLLLIAMVFEMRHYIGRAGAIGAAAMLATSPSVTWLSRSATNSIAAGATGLVTIAIFMAFIARPSVRRAIALGLIVGLLVGVDLAGAATAAALLGSLVLTGLIEGLTTRNAYLRMRVWLTRYMALAIVAIAAAAAASFATQMLVGGPFRGMIAELAGSGMPRLLAVQSAWRALALPLGFYEFAIVIAALIGLPIAIVTSRRNRFVFFAAFWTALGVVLAGMLPLLPTSRVVVVIVPAAIVGGVGLDHLYRTRLWFAARWVAGALLLLAIYLQLAINFVDYAPDSGEVAGTRRANLYWSAGATTIETAERLTALSSQITTIDATVFVQGEWPPAVRWYLRDFRSVEDQAQAALVLDAVTNDDIATSAVDTDRFELEESWMPDPAQLDRDRALRYFFAQQAWGTITRRAVTIHINAPIHDAAPTVIVLPGSR
jgi:predicted membrane-bound mannosyltransferase